jgi:hypothetical protein
MSIILVLEKTHLFHGENIYGCLRTGTIEACIIFGAKYVQKVIDNLNVCFLDMLIFNATRLFSSQQRLLDEIERSQLIEQWLDKLLVRFDWNNDITYQCEGKIPEFVETLMKACKPK